MMSCVRRANDVVVTIVDPYTGQTFAKELKGVSEIVLTADTALPYISPICRCDVILDLTSVCSQANTEFPYEVLCRRRSYEHREPDPLELDLAPCWFYDLACWRRSNVSFHSFMFHSVSHHYL